MWATLRTVAGEGPLAVVQIPRTGGGAVSRAISNNYTRLETVAKYQHDPRKARATLEALASNPELQAVGGPVPFGLFLRHMPRDTRYITILRDPVIRVFADYSMHVTAGEGPGPPDRKRLRTSWEGVLNAARIERDGHDEGPEITLEDDADLSLEAGLARKIPIYENLMTRFLWGGEGLFGELPPDALERAKENLSRFWFVGLGERLDDSIVLLGRRLGAGAPMPYRSRGVNEHGPGEDGAAPQLRELIAEHNALDLELYRFARERFEETAPSPDELERDADELRRRSIQLIAIREAERKAAKTARVAAERAAKLAAKTAKLAAKNETRAAKQTPPGGAGEALLPAHGVGQLGGLRKLHAELPVCERCRRAVAALPQNLRASSRRALACKPLASRGRSCPRVGSAYGWPSLARARRTRSRVHTRRFPGAHGHSAAYGPSPVLPGTYSNWSVPAWTSER